MSVFDGIKLPKTIYEVDSEFNGKISVVEVGSTRKLYVDGMTQSVNWDSPNADRQVWGRLVENLREQAPDLAKVMVLGLGGGSMQHLMTKKFPGIHITSVEIDKAMVDVAKKYFSLDEIADHRIIVADALKVIAVPEEFGISPQSFQAVVVDIYCGQKYPDLGSSGNFFAGVKNLVIPGGLVVFNRIYLEHHQEQVNLFIDSLEVFFSSVKSVIIAGRTNSDNVIVFCRV
jgi:spermidine synthase